MSGTWGYERRRGQGPHTTDGTREESGIPRDPSYPLGSRRTVEMPDRPRKISVLPETRPSVGIETDPDKRVSTSSYQDRYPFRLLSRVRTLRDRLLNPTEGIRVTTRQCKVYILNLVRSPSSSTRIMSRVGGL